MLYGTALQQVGDLVEENKHFNIYFTKTKAMLVTLKLSLSMSLKLLPADVMLYINKD